MDVVKARKQGNAVMVTLSQKFHVSVGQEFLIYKEDDGTITLIPKVADYFRDVKPGEFIDAENDELAAEYRPMGAELDG